MSGPKLIVTAVRYPSNNRFGKLIQLVEGLDWAHVYPIIDWGNGKKDCWNIAGWFRKWYKTTPEFLDIAAKDTYIKVKTWELNLSHETALKLATTWNDFIDRGYGVGRVLLLPLYRLTKWNWVVDLAGLTCSGGLARGLATANLWHQNIAPSMSGLKELKNQLDSLQVSNKQI